MSLLEYQESWTTCIYTSHVSLNIPQFAHSIPNTAVVRFARRLTLTFNTVDLLSFAQTRLNVRDPTIADTCTMLCIGQEPRGALKRAQPASRNRRL